LPLKVDSLIDESNQLISIFVASIKTTELKRKQSPHTRKQKYQ